MNEPIDDHGLNELLDIAHKQISLLDNPKTFTVSTWTSEDRHIPLIRRLIMWKNSIANLALESMCSDHLGSDQLLGLLHKPGRVYCWTHGIAAINRDLVARPNACDGCGRDTKDFMRVVLTIAIMITITGNICADCAEMSGTIFTMDISA